MPRQCRRPGTPTELRCRERITKTTTKHVLYCIFFNEDVSAAFYTHCTYILYAHKHKSLVCLHLRDIALPHWSLDAQRARRQQFMSCRCCTSQHHHPGTHILYVAEAGFATTRVEIIGPKLGSERRTKVVQNVSIGQEMWLRVSAYDICARIFFSGHADRRP